MKPAAALAMIFVLVRGSSSKLTLKTVQTWVDEHSDKDRYEMGYSGNQLATGPSNGFVEITKRLDSGGFTLTAAVYLNPRQGAVASKIWTASKFDAALEQYFGKDMRVRINI